jgi:hypothetical protein
MLNKMELEKIVIFNHQANRYRHCPCDDDMLWLVSLLLLLLLLRLLLLLLLSGAAGGVVFLQQESSMPIYRTANKPLLLACLPESHFSDEKKSRL